MGAAASVRPVSGVAAGGARGAPAALAARAVEAADVVDVAGAACESDAHAAAALRPVAGFESTGYAWLGARLVWVGGSEARGGRGPITGHPRSLHHPWQPPPAVCGHARALRRGARLALANLAAWPPRGLLAWVAGGELPFPLELARARFDALRHALEADDAHAFAAAAPRVLGLGPGLTPSGDDFLGGIFFALAHAPRRRWAAVLPALERALLEACGGTGPAQPATNPISAALLADLMQGRGYRLLHECISALQSGKRERLVPAGHALLALGASSGADLLSGVLLALASTPASDLLDSSPSIAQA